MRTAIRVFAPFLVAGLAYLAAATAAHAGPTFEDQEVNRAYVRALAGATPGPATVTIAGPAQVELPKGYVFIPAKPAQHLLTAIGGSANPKLQGLIVPAAKPQDWHMMVEYDAAGHVGRETARQWTTESILQLLKVGAERGNEHRFEIRAPLLDVDGFVVPASYDAGRHALKFVARVVEVGPIVTTEPAASVDSYVFGREGFVRLTMTLPERSFEAVRAPAFALLDAISFKAGAHDEDFMAGRHNVMSYPDLALFAGMNAADARIYANANGLPEEVAAQSHSTAVAVRASSASVSKHAGPRPSLVWYSVLALAVGALVCLGLAFFS